MAHRPIIAVTAGNATLNGITRSRVNIAYVAAIRAAGATPIVLPVLPPDAAREALGVADGLVLTGGEDVDPVRYGHARHPQTEPPDPERDAWELALVAAARECSMPTLAICRGVQVLNVALGGTLVQDLASERPGGLDHTQSERRAERVHDIRIEPGSRLHAAIGETAIAVNSLHHQAPDRVASALMTVAVAPDGIVEGVETTDEWWVVGVQWHPEELHASAQPWDARLFRAFVEVAHGAPHRTAPVASRR